MDPYLEQRWSDVHAKLVAFIGEALQPNLPRGLRARSEERILLEEQSATEEYVTTYRPDVAIVESGSLQPQRMSGATTTVPEPLLIEFDNPPPIDRWVQIIDVTSGNRVITTIEVLSPWNKMPGRLNTLYLKKLSDYLRANVSVVELDLLRSSRDQLMVSWERLPPDKRAHYLTCIRRAWKSSLWEVYPMSLRQPLPPIPIPLRQTDQDVPLALQPLIERVYVAGGHDDIDYSKPPHQSLSTDDQAWAQRVVREAAV